MASSFRDLFCGCFLSHICTSCTQEGLPLSKSCREVAFSETSALNPFWLSFSRCSMRPLGQRVPAGSRSQDTQSPSINCTARRTCSPGTGGKGRCRGGVQWPSRRARAGSSVSRGGGHSLAASRGESRSCRSLSLQGSQGVPLPLRRRTVQRERCRWGRLG